MTGKVYLIGAGCGDHDLITLRGLRLLEKCSCIIYDALIDERLLGFAPESAELICVGKRSGHHSAKQEDINALIVEKALGSKTVARLKGGDPFVFGRGGEEILARDLLDADALLAALDVRGNARDDAFFVLGQEVGQKKITAVHSVSRNPSPHRFIHYTRPAAKAQRPSS